jgi:dTDP-4-dehydrorhamnose reductase
MKICLTGYRGFIGKHISKYFKNSHSIIKIDLRKIKTENDFNKKRFLNKFKNADLIINCAASLYPKNDNDIFINQNLPKLISDYIKKNIKNCLLIHISTINVLIKNRQDKYSKSKLFAEKILKKNNAIILRLPLVYEKKNNKIQNNGGLRIFFNYLNLKLPFYPMIFPGQIYQPITIDVLMIFLEKIILRKISLKKYYNLSGHFKMSTFEIFRQIAQSQKKTIIKLNLKKILPNFLMKSFLLKYGLFQQIAEVDNTKFSEKKYILK